MAKCLSMTPHELERPTVIFFSLDPIFFTGTYLNIFFEFREVKAGIAFHPLVHTCTPSNHILVLI
jgi:hypothetical protein